MKWGSTQRNKELSAKYRYKKLEITKYIFVFYYQEYLLPAPYCSYTIYDRGLWRRDKEYNCAPNRQWGSSQRIRQSLDLFSSRKLICLLPPIAGIGLWWRDNGYNCAQNRQLKEIHKAVGGPIGSIGSFF